LKNEFNKNEFKKTIISLLSLLKNYKIAIIIIFIFTILSSIFSIISPKILGEAINLIKDGINNSNAINLSKLLNIILTLLILYIISFIFNYFQNYKLAKISANISYNLRKEIIKKINKIPLSFFETKKTGDILSRITNDIDVIGDNLSRTLTQIISSLISISGISLMMLLISPLLTFVTILLLPIGSLITFKIVKYSQKHFKKQQQFLGEINAKVEEIYASNIIVKTNNKEEKELNDFKKINSIWKESAWKSQFLSSLIQPLMNFISNLNYVIIAIIGTYLTILGKIKIGYILSFMQYSKNFNAPIMSLAQMFNLIQSMVASYDRVLELMNEIEEKDIEKSKHDITNLKGDITFENVSFGYTCNKMVLNNLNFEIKKGQKVAIVGKTGAGKTTIVKLLMRFYDIKEGKIKIDGIDIKKFTKKDLRKIFGIVLQDTWLFNGTIKENIAYGNMNASDNEIKKASSLANIDYFIESQKDKYDMQIDEESSNLSSGQKQLLTIARVILKDPKILILDEATSNVDTKTEIAIQKAMDLLMKNKTSFIIAHRLSTIKNADLILVMDEGNIVEKGTHETLIKQKGHYASIYNSQFKYKEF